MRRRPLLIPAALLLGAAVLNACSSTRQVPKPALLAVAQSQKCTADVDDSQIADWRQINHAGISFCVPSTWKLDERFEIIQAQRAARPFRSLSWIAPDSLQRVTVDVPANSSSRNQLLTVLKYCYNHVMVKETEACAGFGAQGAANVLLSDPLVRVEVKGVEDSWIVLSTVRPLISSTGR